jgi:hypothetical protein
MFDKISIEDNNDVASGTDGDSASSGDAVTTTNGGLADAERSVARAGFPSSEDHAESGPEKSVIGTVGRELLMATPGVVDVKAAPLTPEKVAESLKTMRDTVYDGTPAARRDAMAGDAAELRGHAAVLRARADAILVNGGPDLNDPLRRNDLTHLNDIARAAEAHATKLEGQVKQLLSKQKRRAVRDRALDAAEHDPRTGKPFTGPFRFDPMRPEMVELYAAKKTPAAVFADGSKLVRNDAGGHGFIGGLIDVARKAEACAGEKMSDVLLIETVKAFAYDAMERIHGIGAGYCRDAAWTVRLWAEATQTPLRLEDIPVRHPVPSFEAWVTATFTDEWEKGLKRLARRPADPGNTSTTEPAAALTAESTDGASHAAPVTDSAMAPHADEVAGATISQSMGADGRSLDPVPTADDADGGLTATAQDSFAEVG